MRRLIRTLLLFSLFVFLIGGALFAVRTKIKGGKMEFLDKGERVVFSDGVRLIRGNDELLARRMDTTKNRDRVKAQGDVKLYRKISKKESLRGWGDEGFYDTQKGAGYLKNRSGKSRIEYTEVISSTQVKKLNVYSKRVDFFRDKSRALAKGAVYGKSRDPQTGAIYEFWSDEAEYFGADKKVVFRSEDQARVLQTEGEDVKRISGKIIIYYIEEERIISEKDAKAFFRSSEKEENGTSR